MFSCRYKVWLPMPVPDARQRRFSGMARGVRAAILVPTLFGLALLVIRDRMEAGFAVFGSFAHLVMVNYDRRTKARFIESATLTTLGIVMVTLGTLASSDVRLAAGGAFLAGALAEFPGLDRPRIAPIRPALILAFMLAVAVPVPTASVFPYLAGWVMAGLAAQVALWVIWIPLPTALSPAEAAFSRQPVVATGINGDRWIGMALGAGAAMSFAILLTRSLRIDHAFWVILGVLPVLNAQASSPARAFVLEQAGTLAGFVIGAALVAAVGAHQVAYWLALPLTVFAAAYASTAIGFVAGQATFTLFAVVLFCILLPQPMDVGWQRVEDIALGGAVSLAAGSIQRLGRVQFYGRPPR